MVTEPFVYGHNCAMLRSSVVLPLPDGPFTSSASPGPSDMSSSEINASPTGVRTSSPRTTK